MKKTKRQRGGLLFLTLLFLTVILGAAACTEAVPPTDTPSSDTQVSATVSTKEETDPQITDVSSKTETDSATQTSEKTDRPTNSTSDKGYLLNPGNNGRPDGIKRIAFTFDDGPSYNTVTNGIVDEFAKYGGHCTFFVVGNRVYGEHANRVKYAAEKGNEIGIHGYTHTKYYNTCSDSDYQYELSQTAKVIKDLTGQDPKIMRPIGGNITNARINSCPYAVVTWNIDTNDWKYKNTSQANIDTIVNNILRDAQDGGIVLMHDIYGNTYEAVKIALPILKEQGYEFVTVSEILGEKLQPGAKFNRGY